MKSGNYCRSSKFRSIRIDRFLRRENERKKRELQLLLIGPPGAGKYTMSKQLRIHYGDGFPHSSRMQLVPTILANLADAICLVLRNLVGLRIDFSDVLAQRLAFRLLETQPADGFLSTNFRLVDSQPLRSVETHIPINQFGDQSVDHRDRPLDCEDHTSNTSTNRDTSQTELPALSRESGYQNLREALLHILQQGQSVTPSLIKKFEMSSDVTVASEIHSALHDPNKLRKIYLQLCCEENTHSQSRAFTDIPPPVPEYPPPSSVEDDLLESIISLKSTSHSSVSSSSTLGSTGTLDNICLEDTTQLNSNRSPLNNARRLRNTQQSESSLKYESSPPERLNTSLSALTDNPLDQALEPSAICDTYDSTVEDCSLGIPRIWLKLITEQPEFLTAVSGRMLNTPKLCYSDYYFLENTDRIIQDDYVPTLQDILVMRRPSKALREMTLQLGPNKVRIIDLADRCSTVHKLLHYFESISAVICLVPLSGCSIRGQSTKSTLDSCVEMVEKIYFSPYMLRKEFVLFLNKTDLLKTELEENAENGTIESVEDKIANVIDNIKKKFHRLGQKPDTKDRKLNFYVGCALDVDEMKVAFRDCLKNVFDSQRKRHPVA